MIASPPPQPPRKNHAGLARLAPALRHSLAGLRAAWDEGAFRQEVALAVPLIPLAFWLGQGWVEVALLAGSVVGVLIVELLNSGIEAAIDRFGDDWHLLSKRAKDLGSAAVLLALLLAGAIWAAALYHRFLT
ncbi:MAG: diacylglycerol kinase [Burkholderiales bacterium]|uniref:Diacylglycerol kinase n=1 Tax=Ottowia pentelensis TaxID=511108 RepID=A0ABV6PUK4_9BURK|nr:diacylglycerol kinase [Ottowia sp.]MBN9404361.1 diacylglycerol kinase [Burkholderiales bacterium]MBS0401286.1 diacylglycerol kinase [Pseudomonadota bacterium]MBS0404878.1 diacylglycerol kinase [Pseudomonadota bacterium]MBS0412954.1 diacylglycerol kinase [Pseudomonadota bacterium]